MATTTTEPSIETYSDLGRDHGVEALQSILESQQLTAVSYDDAATLGQSLIAFFEAFCIEDKDSGGARSSS